jgi:dihydrofolate reductase
MASVDALVIGATPMKGAVLSALALKPVVVLSSQPSTLSKAAGAVVEQMSGCPRTSWPGWRNGSQPVLDGGVTIQRFLAAGLVQRLVVTRVPVLLGSGIPLFGPLPHDVRLTHIATRAFPSGLVQSEYAVLP